MAKISILFHFFFFISRSLVSSFLRFEFLQNIFTALCLHNFFSPSFLALTLGYTIFSCRFPFHQFSSSYCCYCCFFFSRIFLFYPTFNGMVWLQSILTWSHIHKTSSCIFCCCLPHLFHTIIFGDDGDFRESVCLHFSVAFGIV